MAWSKLDVAGGPSKREDHTWTVDPATSVAYLFGGRRGGVALDDLWRYDLATDSWTELAPAGPGPDARFGHVAVWNPTRGLIVWSGQHDAARFFDDIWQYDPGANTWQLLPAGGAVPLARYGSCGGIGPDGALWISHGFTQDSGRFFDTRAYDLAAGVWTDHTPADSVPVDRCLHDCFWTRAGQLLLYAGQTTGVPALGDMWTFDPVTGAWAEQAKPPAPARQLYALGVLPDEAFVFGGADIDRNFLSDLWRVDLADFSWTRVDAGEPPSARSASAFISDPQGARLLLFGGKNGAGEFGDLWQLASTGSL